MLIQTNLSKRSVKKLKRGIKTLPTTLCLVNIILKRVKEKKTLNPEKVNVWGQKMERVKLLYA